MNSGAHSPETLSRLHPIRRELLFGALLVLCIGLKLAHVFALFVKRLGLCGNDRAI